MKRNYYLVFFILVIFFSISLLTNIIGPLVPEMKDQFMLSNFLAGLYSFAFFIAYGIMSIPAGVLVEKYKEKKINIASFGIAFAGAFLFAAFPNYVVGLLALFLIGIGMTLLQVANNPLLRVAGGEEHFAFNSILKQLFFGGAGFLAPRLYSYITQGLPGYEGGSNILFNFLRPLVPQGMAWIGLYSVFAVIALVMVIIHLFVKFPKVEATAAAEEDQSFKVYTKLLKNKYVILYFFGIFAYVGSEIGIANWISEFLRTNHGLSPQLEGAHTIGWFWGALTIGCLISLALLKLFDSRKILVGAAALALASLTIALNGSASAAMIAFPACGFFLSVMWSVIFSLALNSVAEHHVAFSGILCTGIIGGALVPPIIGLLGDVFGLRFGMMFLYLTLGYILSIGFWAKPLINNATIKLGKRKTKK